MTLEADIFSTVKTACPRIFPDVAPVKTARPYVTYQQIGGDAVIYTEGALAPVENGHVQISVWDDTRVGAKDLIKLIEAALVAAPTFQATPLAASVSDYDPDMERYCSRQDFSIWSQR